MRRYSKHSRNKVFEFQEYTSANGAFSLLSFDNPPKIDYESIHDIFVQLSAISEIDDTSLELSELGVVTDKKKKCEVHQRGGGFTLFGLFYSCVQLIFFQLSTFLF